MKKLKHLLALAIATSIFLALGTVPVHASETKTILSLTGKSGANLNKSLGRLQITHPSSVICTGAAGTSTACVFSVSVQVDNASVLPLQIDLVNGAGSRVGSFTIYGSIVNTVYANVASNMAVYFVVPSSNPTILGTRALVEPINLQVSGTPTPFALTTKFGNQVLDTESAQLAALSKLTFAQYVFPVEMYSSDGCMKFPVYVAAVDFLTGQPASSAMKKDIDFEISVRDSSGFLSGTVILSDRNQTWSSSNATVITFEVCRINAKLGEITNIVLEGKGILRLNGNTITVPFVSDIYIEGTANFRNIACVKGTTAIVVSAKNPACPKGYKKANIVIKNGKLQKSTIRCVKGLSVRKVTAIVPVCPSGFRKG